MKSRFGPLARWIYRRGCRRARQTWVPACADENKKACGCGPPGRLFNSPEGWTSRHTQARRGLHGPLHEEDAQHCAAGSACGEECGRISIGAHGLVSNGGRKKQNPVACGLPGFVELRRPSLRMEWLREAVLRHTPRAANPPLRSGSSMRLGRVERSGVASWELKANTVMDWNQRSRCVCAAAGCDASPMRFSARRQLCTAGV